MKYLKCIIWDLDETLLDTSKLKIFRDMKNWETVRNSFHLVEEYDSLLQIYNRLHKNLNSVIVTNSPSWYCKALIQKFNIKTDHFFITKD